MCTFLKRSICHKNVLRSHRAMQQFHVTTKEATMSQSQAHFHHSHFKRAQIHKPFLMGHSSILPLKCHYRQVNNGFYTANAISISIFNAFLLLTFYLLVVSFYLQCLIFFLFISSLLIFVRMCAIFLFILQFQTSFVCCTMSPFMIHSIVCIENE